MVFGISENETPVLLIFIFCIFIWLGLRFKSKSIFAPWVVTPAVWGVMCLLLILWGNLIYPIKGPFYIALFIWVCVFVVSSIYSYKITQSKTTTTEIFNKRLFYFCIFLSIILTPVYLFIIYKNIGLNYSNIFATLRQNAISGVNDLGVLKYLRVYNPVLLIIGLLELKSIKKSALIYLIIANILMGLAIMEKGTFFLVMIAIMYILYLKRIISVRSIIIGFGIFLFASFMFNILRHGSSSSKRSFSDFFACYIISPCAAFETLKPESSEAWGANTFPFFHIFNNILFGDDTEIVSKVKDFVYVPIATNVYTIMQPFYEDFGYVGVFAFGILTGLFSGFIYKRSMSGSHIMIGLYVYILYSLILQFFQDNLFISLSVVIQFYVFLWIIYSKTVHQLLR